MNHETIPLAILAFVLEFGGIGIVRSIHLNFCIFSGHMSNIFYFSISLVYEWHTEIKMILMYEHYVEESKISLLQIAEYNSSFQA